MKKLFKLMLAFVSACLLITSCKTASLTKRHYNKGYYVSHSGKNAKAAVHTNDASIAVTKAETLTPKITTMPVTSDDRAIASNIATETFTPKAAPAETKKVENKLRYSTTDNAVTVREMVANPFKLTKVVSASDSDKDALSLLWILIVVLLIVYIAGLLLDNFGLGGIIHILGVIILVLLILWLLRII